MLKDSKSHTSPKSEPRRIIILEPEEKHSNRQRYEKLLLIFIFAASLGALAAIIATFLNHSSKNPWEPSSFSTFIFLNGSGKPDFFSLEQNQWFPIQPDQKLPPFQKVRTDLNSHIDFKISESQWIRLRPGSELHLQRHIKNTETRLFLKRGGLFILSRPINESHAGFTFATDDVWFRASPGVFMIRTDARNKRTQIQVLEGLLRVETPASETIAIPDHHKCDIYLASNQRGVRPLSAEDWKEFLPAKDLNLSEHFLQNQTAFLPQIGTLFQYPVTIVQGVNPKKPSGYARAFIDVEPDTRKPFWNVHYDVFAPLSAAMISVKIDLPKPVFIESLSFESKATDQNAAPTAFSVHFYSHASLIRKMDLLNLSPKWRLVVLPIRFSKHRPLTEIKFVFDHSRVGKSTHGALALRNINLHISPPVTDDKLGVTNYLLWSKQLFAHSKHTESKKTGAWESKTEDLTKSQNTSNELDALVLKLQNLNKILKQNSAQEIPSGKIKSPKS